MLNKRKVLNITKYLCITMVAFALATLVTTVPVFCESTTETGKLVDSLWDNTIYPAIKDIGGTLAIATFVCSAFYFFIIGKDARSLEKAKALMIGSGAGIVIIYVAPKIIKIIIDAVSKSVS